MVCSMDGWRCAYQVVTVRWARDPDKGCHALCAPDVQRTSALSDVVGTKAVDVLCGNVYSCVVHFTTVYYVAADVCAVLLASPICYRRG